LKNIWTKLFSKNNEANEIALHVSGAIVRHRNPFEELHVPRNSTDLSNKFIEKWVAPFYMGIHSKINESNIPLFVKASQEINIDIVKTLLGDFNWRTRLSGAFFAAVHDYKELEESIGNLLLKSEVCYAGTGYCLALAIFNTETSKDYLVKYLKYYLTRKDLWFDQAAVYCALDFLDKDAANKFDDAWRDFVIDKPRWNIESHKEHFHKNIEIIKEIRRRL
jgi:hypothetical protein